MSTHDEFGPDTDAIRRWLEKRATYAEDRSDPGRHRAEEAPTITPPPSATTGARAATPAPTVDPLPATAPRPDVNALSRDVVGAVEPETPAAQPRVPPSPAMPRKRYAEDHEPADLDASLEALGRASTNYVFKPRTGVRWIITAILLLALLGTAGAAYLAYRDPAPLTIGLGVVMLVLTLVVWGARATSAPIELAVVRGQLETLHDGRFDVINLSSPFTPVAVVGEPGKRGWKVYIERPDRPLLVLTKAVVDPHQFTKVLYRVRPDLDPTHVEEPES